MEGEGSVSVRAAELWGEKLDRLQGSFTLTGSVIDFRTAATPTRTYEWMLDSGPAGSTANFSPNDTVLSPSITINNPTQDSAYKS